MEKKIRAYEKFIKAEAKKEMGERERGRLLAFHNSMLANFQHERLIHLIITLFFAFFTIVFLFITAWEIINYGLMVEALPLYLLTIIMTVLTGCYVRHYYFLENHIQNLYKYTQTIAKI